MFSGRLADVMDSRNRRRWAVLVFYLGLALFFSFGLATSGFWPYHAIGYISFLISVVVSRALSTSIRNIIGNPIEGLDERQQMVRDRTYRQAYNVLLMVLMLVLLYLAFAAEGYRLWLPQGPNEFWISATFIFLLAVAYLPTTVAAWTEPDPEEESG